MPKVWFVTGAARGLGRHFVEAALSRGDRVAATARDTGALTDLLERYGEAVLALPLDVTDRAAAVRAVTRAHRHFGRLDVVVNNAGYGLFGMVEELTEQHLRDQLETNFFGAVWVTQAALPLLRAQGAGHIVQISTVAGVVSLPALGGYNASKWALEGLTEALAAEVAGTGIKVTLVEPGRFGTDWAGSSAVHAEPLPVYADLRAALRTAAERTVPADPSAAARALITIVDAENPPLRVLFGSTALPHVTAVYHERLRTWNNWAEVSNEAQGNPPRTD
ncbi:SDR family NAD(P)-dependent oxidoreductase [Nocardia sp. 2]|uniref:SDR family NAD(P)-dependent oxidoreductase n=1 Tax=Nocardia acididurans TaxID=2802282 RepID=A0ABS1MHQ1_9NOCA|nr:SDR family NAD(P)-dependent oxidoreductase [Nocardia acididurans]MBL1080193.1 SDR family NAD(P)-dependent oxidoreductase [Nocardia acididurans]